MNYSYSDILRLAGEKDSAGYSYTEIDLAENETACNPASTKRMIFGPAKIIYEIHPSGITTYVQ